MAIPDEDVARVRAATDMVALVGEHAALKRQGRRWVGLCPFHQERSPSFSVNAEEGLYYCFGCQRSGDAITFVRETEHLDFAEAVRRLADRAGLTIHEDEAVSADRQRRAPLYEAVERAVAWYHERLLHAPDAGPARQYLRSRGYDAEVVRQFRLGWAPDGWDELARHLKVSDAVLTDSGLGFVNRRGRQQDAFRGRVLFPIFDPSARAIALGGRVVPGRAPDGGQAGSGPGPKYKNSQDGPLYAKRRVLYALNWAKHDVIASGEVVVCEGYTDVIGCFVAGLPRAVATCGTALGEDHFRLLSNFAKRIVLAYDADSAGRAGAGRVYEWERGHQVDVAVADLPPGSDPGELARSDPEALRAAVAGARPFLQFRVDQVLGAADLRHPEGRARAAEEALAAVAEHPNELVRDQYLMQVADRCQLQAPAMRDVLDRLVAAGPATAPSGGRRPASPGRGDARPPASGAHRGEDGTPRRVQDGSGAPETAGGPPVRRRSEVRRTFTPGLEALRWAVHEPGQVAGHLQRFLFVDPVERTAFDALVETDSLHQAIEHAQHQDARAAELLHRLVQEEPSDPADSVVAQLVRNATRAVLGRVDAQQRHQPERFAEAAAETAAVWTDLQALSDDNPDSTVVARLVAWLGRRAEEGA